MNVCSPKYPRPWCLYVSSQETETFYENGLHASWGLHGTEVGHPQCSTGQAQRQPGEAGGREAGKGAPSQVTGPVCEMKPELDGLKGAF